jgi:hypothetical protein
MYKPNQTFPQMSIKEENKMLYSIVAGDIKTTEEECEPTNEIKLYNISNQNKYNTNKNIYIDIVAVSPNKSSSKR